jgi:hypothetical protein
MTRGRELPDRVCGKPSDGIGRFCPFIDHCFEGWTPPTVEELRADEELIARTARLHELKRRRQALSQEDTTLEKECKEIQADLDEVLAEGDVREVLIGGYLVKRSPRTRENFSLKKARASVPADILDPFTSHSHFTVYDVEKTADAVPAPDRWGDDAPWTEEDL